MFWPHREQERRIGALPRGITVRRANEEDEFTTFDVMRKSMGYNMNWSQHSAIRKHLNCLPDTSCWVAEEKPLFGSTRIVGYARSVVRDNVWSLTEFFVLPGHHKQGIGADLLSHSIEDGKQQGAVDSLVLASLHPGANSLYIRKLGCLPRLPMLLMAGSLDKLLVEDSQSCYIQDFTRPGEFPLLEEQPSGTDGDVILRAEPIVLTDEVQEAFAELDREIVGYARPEEHALWAKEMGGFGGAARLFRRSTSGSNGSKSNSKIVGYAYLGSYFSGPVLAVDPTLLPSMLAHVTKQFRTLFPVSEDNEWIQTNEHFLAVAGTNEHVLQWLLSCGWQIAHHYLFMSTRPQGHPDQYIGFNPLYFW